MTTTTELLSAIGTGFGTAVTLGYDSSTAAHDIYEGYILSLLCGAATGLGWKLEFRDGNAKPTSHLLFRLGPGRLSSKKFTHVYLTKNQKTDLEAHIGVKVVGKAPRVASNKFHSGPKTIVHEFDLLVLPSADADNCRKHDTDPSSSSVVIHAEAKFYGSDLPLPIGRGVVGLAAECDLAGKSVLVTNRNGATVEDLIRHYRIEFRFLVTPSGKGESHIESLFKQFLLAAP